MCTSERVEITRNFIFRKTKHLKIANAYVTKFLQETKINALEKSEVQKIINAVVEKMGEGVPVKEIANITKRLVRDARHKKRQKIFNMRKNSNKSISFSH